MLKIILMFLKFIKELVFESKDETVFTNHKFNSRKAIIYSIISVLAFAVVYLTGRLYSASATVVQLKAEVAKNKLEDEKQQRYTSEVIREELSKIRKEGTRTIIILPGEKTTVLTPSDSENNTYINK